METQRLSPLARAASRGRFVSRSRRIYALGPHDLLVKIQQPELQARGSRAARAPVFPCATRTRPLRDNSRAVTATISPRALRRRRRRDVRARATRGCRSEPAAPRDRSGSHGGTRLGGAERALPRAGARAPTTNACVGVGLLCSCRCVSRVSLPCGARIVRTACDGSVTVG
jgi:hypothetical protein